MASLNRVFLIGNLTKDPELRYTPGGAAVANLRMAVNSVWKDQQGQRKEETCFITVVVWGKQAEACQQYLKKGRPIFVEGRLLYRSWEQEGKTRSTIEVRADRVQFLGSRGESGGPDAGERSESRVDEEVPAAVEPASSGAGSQDLPDDEPPF